MSPPTRRGPGAGDPGLSQNIALTGCDRAHRTVIRPRGSMTTDYLDGRERVLGGRLVLHREESIGAALLIEVLGPQGARRWLRRMLAEVGQ